MRHHDDVSTLDDHAGSRSDDSTVTLVIDGLAYEIPNLPVTVRDIRSLPHPPISPDRDVWLEGNDSDRFLLDDEVIAPSPGLRIFTSPRSIMAGR
jgi:hypothetical protein